MRIIAGEQRGTPLKTLDGQNTRPTLERVKEGIFSALQFILPGAVVLDLYAGSGQLGLEALSRQAAVCTFVDESKDASVLIRQNAEKAGSQEKCRIRRQTVESFLAQSTEKFDIILADPPYKSGVLPGLLAEIAGCCADGAVVMCESEPGLPFPEEINGLRLQKQYRYGTVVVTRYHYEPGAGVEG